VVSCFYPICLIIDSFYFIKTQRKKLKFLILNLFFLKELLMKFKLILPIDDVVVSRMILNLKLYLNLIQSFCVKKKHSPLT
jgi:hypothetical protein